MTHELDYQTLKNCKLMECVFHSEFPPVGNPTHAQLLRFLFAAGEIQSLEPYLQKSYSIREKIIMDLCERGTLQFILLVLRAFLSTKLR